MRDVCSRQLTSSRVAVHGLNLESICALSVSALSLSLSISSAFDELDN